MFTVYGHPTILYSHHNDHNFNIVELIKAIIAGEISSDLYRT